jgi:imidazole glycerol-phosphate synthase subunit HisF
MAKIRVLPTLLFKDLGLVKGVAFDSWRRVGSVMQAIKVYNLRQVDEVVFLDIAATEEQRPPDFELVDEIADECFMPLTVGGGVRTLEHVRKLLQVGADKVAVNTAAVENPEFVRQIAETFGSQCVVVSIDFKRLPGGACCAYTRSGTRATGRDPLAFAKEMEERGAGEILLTSIDRDGTMSGYDNEVIRAVSDALSVPVIASGGAGNYQHMLAGVREGNASALAAASMYHFTEQTPLEAKRYLHGQGVAVRL